MTNDFSNFEPTVNEIEVLRQRVAFLEHTNERFQEQEQMLRRIADAAPAVLYVYDLIHQRTIYINEGITRLLGYTPHWIAALGPELTIRLTHPDDLQRASQIIEQLRAAEDGEIVEAEVRQRHVDGSWRWLLNRAVVFERRDTGEVTLVLGTLQDITVLKQEQETLQHTQNRLTTILESITDAFFALDINWCFTYLNREAEILLQRSRDELLNRNIWEMFPQAVGSTFEREYQRAQAENTTVNFEAYYAPLERWFEVHAYPSLDGLAVYFRDATLHKREREQLTFQANVLAHVHDAVIACDACQTITYWNEGAEYLYSYTRAEVLGRQLPDVLRYRWFDSEDETRMADTLAKTGHWRGQGIHRSKQGTDITVDATISVLSDGPGAVRGVLYVTRDITAHKRVQDLLQWRTLHDTLTYLPNRLFFLDRLGSVLEHLPQYENRHCAVLFLDIDNFKVVNDSMGHMVGDRMLIAVARKIQACVPSDTMVARFGGDEFIVLLDPVDSSQQALDTASRLHAALETPIVLDQYSRVVAAVSIGIAFSSSEYRDPEDLLRDANVAMHHAKRQGGARTLVFDAQMYTQARERLWLETELRRAIEHEELAVVYQPIVSLATDKLVGFEVLSRWHHPQRGFISPDTFIQVAEETGLIGAIDRAVLRGVCKQARLWIQKYQLEPWFTINVNISGKEFASPDLVDQVARVLEETGLEPFHLKLEITESVAMDRAEATVTALQRLNNLGVQVALDDFGMGYSSLRYLPRFPIQTLKIDRSFVGTMGQKAESEIIVRTIVTMAHTLGLDVVAEGVETSLHQDYLKEMTCDYGQGYFFARPLSAEDAEMLFARERITDDVSA